MKKLGKLTLTLALVCMISLQAMAQRIATVDIAEILKSVPEYTSAQQEVDKLAARWQSEVDQKYDRIKGLYNRYQAEQVLMSDEMRIKKEEEIMKKESEVREFQRSKFGPEGALFQKRSDLVKPIQDKVYKAIEKFASDKGFDFILDKSSTTGLIFANERYDKTAEIIKSLGQ